MIEAKGVGFCLPNGRVLFRDLKFSLNRGEVLWVKGPNGSGKSTLLDLIQGYRRIQNGTIQTATGLRMEYLPQVEADKIHLPINLLEVAQLRCSHREDIVKQVLDAGLLEKKHLMILWNQASGGEKKRALLTAAFLRRPDVLILDEPFNHLDAQTRALLTQKLEEFIRARGSLILSSHQSLFSGSTKLQTVELENAD